MKKIGKGLFSTAYLVTPKTVKVVTVDPMKEALYDYCQGNAFAPKIYSRKALESEKYGMVENEYTMKYYKRVTSLKNSLKPSHWKLYKELRKVQQKYPRGYRELTMQFNKMNVHWRQKELIQELLDGVAAYDYNVCFEISPRNVAVDNGKLILLDCFFSFDAMIKVRQEKMKRNNVW